MKGSFKDILEKLAVGRELAPYESVYWQASNEETGELCSAEVRCNAYADAIEAELQLMTGDRGDGTYENIKQWLWCESKPRNGAQWEIFGARVQGKDFTNAKYEWDEKFCKFFRAAVRVLKQDKVPDLEDLEKTELHDGEMFGDRQGDGSGRNVKINTNSLVYDNKKGMGM